MKIAGQSEHPWFKRSQNEGRGYQWCLKTFYLFVQNGKGRWLVYKLSPATPLGSMPPLIASHCLSPFPVHIVFFNFLSLLLLLHFLSHLSSFFFSMPASQGSESSMSNHLIKITTQQKYLSLSLTWCQIHFLCFCLCTTTLVSISHSLCVCRCSQCQSLQWTWLHLQNSKVPLWWLIYNPCHNKTWKETTLTVKSGPRKK